MVLEGGGAIVSLAAPSDAFLVPTSMIVGMHPKRSSAMTSREAIRKSSPSPHDASRTKYRRHAGRPTQRQRSCAKNWPTVALSGFGQRQALTGSRRPASRPAISASDSATIRSTNSPTVGMS